MLISSGHLLRQEHGADHGGEGGKPPRPMRLHEVCRVFVVEVSKRGCDNLQKPEQIFGNYETMKKYTIFQSQSSKLRAPKMCMDRDSYMLHRPTCP